MTVIDARTREAALDRLGEAQARGAGQVVPGGRGAGVEGEDHVRGERLAVPLLVVEDAVVATHAQTAQFDAVSHLHAPVGRRAGRAHLYATPQRQSPHHGWLRRRVPELPTHRAPRRAR